MKYIKDLIRLRVKIDPFKTDVNMNMKTNNFNRNILFLESVKVK